MSIQSIDQPSTPSEVIYKELAYLPGYRIGSDGSVWSERGRPRGKKPPEIHTGVWKRLKGGRLLRGHLYVNLATRKGGWPYLIHRLVLEAFVGPCPPGMEGCHDPDPNPSNNRLDNLRWDTPSANAQDAIRQERLPRGSKKWTAKLHESDIPVIRALHRRGWINRRIADAFQVSEEAIRRIIIGQAWVHVVDCADAMEEAVLGPRCNTPGNRSEPAGAKST